MLFSENDKNKTTKTVLVAPLDWGLGHAARSIPVIQELQNCSFRIIIAADGSVEAMLKKEFPLLQFTKLEGYKIRYSKNKRWFKFRLLIQFPKILSSVVKEHRWLNKAIKELSIDAVISDNRFGLFNATVPCIYLTHQLFVKTGNRLSDLIATIIHTKYIKNYTHCWIPDYPGEKNMAGSLSHVENPPANVQYIGCLSRLKQGGTSEITKDLLIVLSGPEPQRSIFEKMLLQQLKGRNERVLLVRGLPADDRLLQPVAGLPATVEICNHLDAASLNQAMLQSRLIISRSGYTSIMDLMKLGCKALLVPTPGQTEQEYLARYLSAQHFFCSLQQQDFNLDKAVQLAENFNYQIPSFNMELYKQAVQQWAASL